MSTRSPSVGGLTSGPVSSAELSAHRYWGRYSGPTSLPNASGNAASGPAYAALQVGDTAFDLSTGTLYYCFGRGTSGGGDAVWGALGTGAVTGLNLVWEWNETDLTQFDVVGDAGFTASVTTWNTLQPSWPDETPVIQIDNPGTLGFYGLLIKQTELDLSAYAGKSLFCTWTTTNTTPAGTQDPLYIAYYEDDTHLLAIMEKSNSFQMSWRNGSTTWVDTTVIQDHTAAGFWGDSIRFGFRYRQFASALQSPIVVQRPEFFNPGPVNMEPRVVQWDLSANFDASWNALGSYQPRIGIGCRSYGTATSPGNPWTNLRIFTYS